MTAPSDNTAESREGQVRRLDELVNRASRLRGLRGLSDTELLEFGRLYRRVASELSYARSHGFDAQELQHLNWLVGRAYGLLYVSQSSGWAGVARFFRAELPLALRRHGKLIALCGLLFFGAALMGAVLTLARPDILGLTSPGLAEAVESLAARHEGGRDWLPDDFRPMAASLIMINNIQVSLLAFSTGILLGIGTVFVLLFNGFMLGALAAGVSRTPAAVHFWAFVAPHGVLELPAIIISGAAGLLLGFAIVDPGEHSRLDALRLAGRQSAVIMLGVAVFLVVAGLVEGLFSPLVTAPVAKFAAAAALAAGLIAYVMLPGRRGGSPRAAPSTSSPDSG
jgi:uncharacterized membrane protein SpoIIM required for sporulation